MKKLSLIFMAICMFLLLNNKALSIPVDCDLPCEYPTSESITFYVPLCTYTVYYSWCEAYGDDYIRINSITGCSSENEPTIFQWATSELLRQWPTKRNWNTDVTKWIKIRAYECFINNNDDLTLCENVCCESEYYLQYHSNTQTVEINDYRKNLLIDYPCEGDKDNEPGKCETVCEAIAGVPQDTLIPPVLVERFGCIDQAPCDSPWTMVNVTQAPLDGQYFDYKFAYRNCNGNWEFKLLQIMEGTGGGFHYEQYGGYYEYLMDAGKNILSQVPDIMNENFPIICTLRVPSCWESTRGIPNQNNRILFPCNSEDCCLWEYTLDVWEGYLYVTSSQQLYYDDGKCYGFDIWDEDSLRCIDYCQAFYYYDWFQIYPKIRDLTIGIHNENEATSIVKPNPTKGVTDIIFTSNLTGWVKLEIFSLYGSKLIDIELSKKQDEIKWTIDTYKFINGAYFYRISIDGCPVKFSSFVVAH